MCQIAGYAGSRRVAPILIEMLKKQEFIDGGICTGIATIYEGKIHMRKVVGDVSILLKETDALDLPGTVGIIHSRPSGKYVEHAHPFLSADNNTAVILNGIGEQTNTPEYIKRKTDIITEFYNRGDNISSAIDADVNKFVLPNGKHFHPADTYAHYINDLVKKGMGVSEAMYTAIDDIPGDIVIAALNLSEPDAITLSRVTRPCSIALGNGETFFTTCPIGFPEDAGDLTVFSAPVAAVCKVKAGTFSVEPYRYKSFRIEPATPKAYAKAYNHLKEILSSANSETALGIDEFGVRKHWNEMWSKPNIDCVYSTGRGYLKPYVEVTYACLYDFYKQGILKWKIGKKTDGRPVRKFWLEQ